MKTEKVKIDLGPVAEYEELYLHQDKSCAICGEGEYLCNMNVDPARGLICPSCKVILNRADRNPEVLLKAAEYLTGANL